MSSSQDSNSALQEAVPSQSALEGSQEDESFLPDEDFGELAPLGSDLDDLTEHWLRPLPGRTLRDAVHEMESVLVELDLLIERQLNAILHEPKFQRLEAAWRGVRYLVNQLPVPQDKSETDYPPVKILLLCVTWSELEGDLTGEANVIESTTLFRRVYIEHFGTAGGEPIGLLIGNYELLPDPETLNVLSAVRHVAAAAFCPFVTGVSPKFWGVDSFTELRIPEIIQSRSTPPRIPEFHWNNLRRHEDTRFLGLAVPRVVLRRPHEYQSYQTSDGRKYLLRFQEDVSAPDLSGHLWGTAAWAWGEVAIREFLETRWFGEMTGVEPAILDADVDPEDCSARGIVVGLPILSYQSDRPGLQPKPATDLFIDEHIDELFVEQGFLTLARCPGGPYSAFYAAPSLQLSKVFTTRQANANALLSSTLDAMLCVSRFAHYLKRYGREYLGRMTSPEELQSAINSWLQGYVGNNVSPDASRKKRSEFPLTAARVEVRPDQSHYGAYSCELHLCPRLAPDGLITSIQLMTQFSPDGVGSESSRL